MRNHQTFIDPQLRTAGTLASLVLRPHLTGFRLANALMQLQKERPLKGVNNSTLLIPRSQENSHIRTRVYKPLQCDKALPVVLLLHGGGYAMGVPENDHALIACLMATRACVVVSPDYRLSLKHPYPAGLHDCYDTLLWIKNNLETLGGRPDQIIVAGQSAGGGLTAAISLLARDKGDVRIAFQMPLYPMLDDRQTTRSAVGNTMPVWNSKHNALGWELYLRDLKNQGQDVPVYAAPARETNYSNLPPTITFVGELDPFRDETIAYVNHLNAAGVPTIFKRFNGCFHAFEEVAKNATVSKAATTFLLESFAFAVDHYVAPQVEGG